MEDQSVGRLDKWLWCARLCKTRAIASKLVSDGKVRVNTRRTVKPGTRVRVGDGLSVALSGRIVTLRILAIGLRRGPATEAQTLYESLGDDIPTGINRT